MTSTKLHTRKGSFNTVLVTHCERGIIETAAGVSLIVLLTLPKMDEYFESSLVLHLAVQHMLLIVAGFMVAQGLDRLILVIGVFKESVSKAYSALLRLNVKFNRRGLLAFTTGALILVYWHFPSNFNTALANESIHGEMHVSLLIAGSLFFVGFKLLTPNMRILTYIAGCKAMQIFGACLIVSPVMIYGSFPQPEQVEAGAAMVGMCIASDAVILPVWLRRLFMRSGT
jgi:cytochrome c oxidase assembly factor CtaG